MRRRLMVAGIAATVTTSALLLTGCQPTTTDGGIEPVSQAGCDPNGWGPLNNCGDNGAEQSDPDTGGGACDPSGWGPLADACADNEPGDSSNKGDPPPQRSAAVRESAYHEAAHYVVAQEYGMPVCDVWIDLTGEGEARGDQIVYGATEPCGRFHGDHYQLVALFAAGPLFGGHTDGDDAQIAALLDDAEADGLDPDAIEDRGYAEAERITTARSAEIDQVAADLLADGVLG